MFIDGTQWFFAKVSEIALSSFASWSTVMSAVSGAIRSFIDFENHMAWPYLVSNLLMAWCLYLIGKRSWVSEGQSFLSFAFPRRLYCHPSTWLDFRFVALDVLLKFSLYVPVLTGIGVLGTRVMGTVVVGIFGWEPPRTLSPFYALGSVVGFFLLYDLINYWSHVLFHKIPMLWSFHRVHHAAEVLTPITAYRSHPVEYLVTGILGAPVVGMAAVFFQNLSSQDMQVAAIFGVNAFTFLFSLFGYHLRHSHVWLSYGPVLSRVFISPAQHQIHHSVDPRHRDKNFGIRFALWDALFGTLYVPKERESLTVGLSDADPQEFATVRQLYFIPFAKAARALVGLAVKCLSAGLSQERCR